MEIFGKEVEFFPGERTEAPLVVLNTYGKEGAAVREQVGKIAAGADFSLVAVSGLAWDDDLSPWPCPPIMRGDAPCGGRADDYLAGLCGEILPRAREEMGIRPCWTGIAGYSLGGLFALYAAYRTDAFDRVASASGSFWYPRFLDYARDHSLKKAPESLYLSLGDKEARAQNKVLQTVQENTEALYAHYKALGIETTFELNPGNHFYQNDYRMAKGIAWILR